MRAIIIMACMGMAHAHPHMNDGHVMHDLMMQTNTKNLLLKKNEKKFRAGQQNFTSIDRYSFARRNLSFHAIRLLGGFTTWCFSILVSTVQPTANLE